MLILVDAYNLMFAADFFDRDDLIQSCAQYKKSKSHINIKLVFDGTYQGSLGGEKDKVHGIDIVYTRLNEIADDWIEQYLLKNKHRAQSILVVSSDNKVMAAAKAIKAQSIKSQEFAKVLKNNSSMNTNVYAWEEGRQNIDDLYQDNTKKGNPKRRSKKEKQKNKVMQKIKK